MAAIGPAEIVILLLLIAGVVALVRSFSRSLERRHTERMRAIDRGLVLSPGAGPWAGLACLGIGVVVPIVCFGLGLFVLFEGAERIEVSPPGFEHPNGDDAEASERIRLRDTYVQILFSIGGASLLVGALLSYLVFRPRRAESAPALAKPPFEPDPMGADSYDVPEHADHR